MASRSKETRRAREVWGEVMQLLVRSGIGASEYEHLLNHRPAAFRRYRGVSGRHRGVSVELFAPVAQWIPLCREPLRSWT